MDYSKFKNLKIGHYLTILLHHNSHLNHKKLEQELRKVGLTVERFIILHAICTLGGITNPSSITRETILEPHAISAVLVRMEKDGLITRTSYDKPKNMVKVELTEKAKGLIEQAWLKMPKMDEFWKDCLTNEEVKTLLTLLEKVREHNLPVIYGDKKRSYIPIPKYDPKTKALTGFYSKL
ncbi:MAG: hypothetical protein QY871_06230 [Dehalococcoides mccartyi]|uniref:MarR family winged helix-turn-helix transcriptional regulator n=1 Tax=Dehalococcoides mccartyi TaxID=61435 RepID=UPI0025CB600B|nr:MarR family transcriptional regulator [Dehalococcoides mccartyi]MDN4186647.1 hypothetical protein [Dehalococcoides mccartyi]